MINELALKWNLSGHFSGRAFECSNCTDLKSGVCPGQSKKGYESVMKCMIKNHSGGCWLACAESARGVEWMLDRDIEKSLNFEKTIPKESPLNSGL